MLSAKYGLVRLEARLEPYEMQMGAAGSVDDQTVKEQAERLGITGKAVVALGGRRYVGLIRRVWLSLDQSSAVETPLENKGGMFQQMAWLKKRQTEGVK